MEQRFGGVQPIGNLIRERNIVLRGADPVTQRGFTQVPNVILRSPDLSVGAKLAYSMLLGYAWGNDFCFPGQAKLAKDMGVSLRSANTHIKELEQSGFVRIERRGLGKPNIYELFIKATKR